MSARKESSVDAWVMTAPGAPLEQRALPYRAPSGGEVTVEVAGCGVCHTDLSFLYHGVKVRAELPLVLGHEISGVVCEVGAGVDAQWIGRPVLIPAVLPCGECELCRAGRRAICRAQVMPGNDRHGGFASHVTVPARYLCVVEDAVLARHELWQIAVVADAVTTPFQAIARSGLQAGEFAVIVGAGGVGIHGVQIAAATGAKVLALDVSSSKLEQAKASGAHAGIDVTGKDVKDVIKQVRVEAERIGAPKHLWKIYETSGTRAGQETAFGLMGFGSVLSIVGFTMDKVEVRLSNLMAFDAVISGNWGCDPELYPEVLRWIAEGKIRLAPHVERYPLSEINQVFAAAHHGELQKRAVLVP